MKIAILNLSNNITAMGTVSSGETIMIGEVLKSANHDVTIISKTDTENTISFENVKDINEYDKLIVVNGSINFFGGVENPIITNNYKLMAQYKDTIYYLFTDIKLPFKQLWPMIEKRGWGYSKEDVWVTSDIKVISQGRNLDVTRSLHKNSEVVHFPLEQYYLFLHNDISDEKEKTTDIIYGGSYRSGAREKKMVEYLFDIEPFEATMFGNIREKQFKKVPYTAPPRFDKKVKISEMRNKLGEGYATLIIGDPLYYDNFITLRVWEAMTSNAVMLIDEEFDSNHKIIDDERFYVSNKKDLISALDKIKNNELYRSELLNVQAQRVLNGFNKEAWLNNFMEVLDIEN